MKVRFTYPSVAPSAQQQRGAAPVGVLFELPPVESTAIIYLRAWCAGGTDRQMIGQGFSILMGPGEATAATQDFDALMVMLVNNARRPIMRHCLGCKCFGGDESAFANMIAAAAGQDHEDAHLFACTLMAGRAARPAINVALRLGPAFLRFSKMPDGTQAPTHGWEATCTKH